MSSGAFLETWEKGFNCWVLYCLLLFKRSVMLLFAHIGITLGTATLLANLVPRRPFSNKVAEVDDGSVTEHRQTATAVIESSAPGVSWFHALRRYADIRFILVGSLLPDIIDKPVGQVFFRETFSNGRIFSHSLLFVLALGVPGIYLYRRYHKTWLTALAAGSLMHLVLDSMWRSPRTLLWPLYGFTFPRADITDWLSRVIWASLTTHPEVYVPELVGLTVVVCFAWVLLDRKTIFAFLRHGQIR